MPPAFRFPTEFYLALTHPTRLWMIRKLANGGELTATDVARARNRKFFAINAHCKALLKAGIVASKPGPHRSKIYFIPAEHRREPGWLNYDWCRVRIS